MPGGFARGFRKTRSQKPETMGIRVCAPVFWPALCIFIDLFGLLVGQNQNRPERGGEKETQFMGQIVLMAAPFGQNGASEASPLGIR